MAKFSDINWKNPGDSLQQAFFSEQQESRHCPVRMRRSFTPTAPQQFSGRKSV